jgi:DNA polymerase III subunit gamma/tau
VPAVADDVSLGEAERTRGRAFAASLSMRVLSRTWQMLLKGLSEVQEAPKPIAAAEMVLVRIAYAADLPSPDEVIRSLAENETETPRSGQSAAATASPPPIPSGGRAAAQPARTVAAPVRDSVARAPEPASAPAQAPIVVARFEDLVALASEKRDLVIKTALERDVRLVRFEDGKLEVALEPGAARTLVGELSRKLSQWTGRRWMVVVSAEQGAPTVKAQADARRAELVRGVAADPLVQAVLTRFPGAEIVDVRSPFEPAPPPEISADETSPGLSAGDDDAFGAEGAPDDVDDER